MAVLRPQAATGGAPTRPAGAPARTPARGTVLDTVRLIVGRAARAHPTRRVWLVDVFTEAAVVHGVFVDFGAVDAALDALVADGTLLVGTLGQLMHTPEALVAAQRGPT